MSLVVVPILLAMTLSGCGGQATAPPHPGMRTATAPAAAPAARAPAAGEPGVVAPPASSQVLALSAEGLDLVNPANGAIRHLPFGVDMPLVIAAVTRIHGEPRERFENPECGAGALQTVTWGDGLTLQFQHDKLVGWSIDAPAVDDGRTRRRLTTVAGIGPGSTRTELEAAYATEVFASTIGTEFSAGSLFGLLDSPRPDARVTFLWAGTTCIFR